MKAQAKVNIHNRFDIFFNDKQVGYAENIVLGQMYTRLCGRSSYFVNIHFGIGTGTLSASRTSLFTHLGTKTAVNDAQSKALPTSWWRQKIVLNPEEYVGSALSEVGIAFGSTSTNLVTHALIRDMNGNVITLTKSALDVVTIYATVYVTFSTSNPNIAICDVASGTNPLINYLIGGAAWPANYFSIGVGIKTPGKNTRGLTSKSLFDTASLTITTDVPNKRFYTETKRIAIGESNGHLTEICYGWGTASGVTTGIFNLKLPADGIYAGLNIDGASIGSGDGVTKKFTLPSKNIDPTSIVVYVDDVETAVSNEDVALDFGYQLAYLPSSMTNTLDATITPDKNTIVAVGAGAPYLFVGDWSDGGWVARPIPSGFPAGQANGCGISDNGQVLAVGFNSSPYVVVYDWVDNNWTARATPSGIPGAVEDCTLSYDGLLLAVASSSSPYILTYDWNGTSWTKRDNPAALPSSYAIDCELSYDKSILAVSHYGSPYITVYDWNGSAWIKRANPSELPVGNGYCCSLTPNGLVLAVGSNSSPYITVYDWSGSAWIKRANPLELPSGSVYGCGISSDGLVLAVGTNVTPYIAIYDWSGSAWVKRANPSTYPGTNGTTAQAALSTDGTMFLVANGTVPYTWIYDTTKTGRRITFASPPANGAVITADYTVNGIHKTAQRVIDLYAEIVFGEVT